MTLMKMMLVIVVAAMLMVGEKKCNEGVDDDTAVFLRAWSPLFYYLVKPALLV